MMRKSLISTKTLIFLLITPIINFHNSAFYLYRFLRFPSFLFDVDRNDPHREIIGELLKWNLVFFLRTNNRNLPNYNAMKLNELMKKFFFFSRISWTESYKSSTIDVFLQTLNIYKRRYAVCAEWMMMEDVKKLIFIISSAQRSDAFHQLFLPPFFFSPLHFYFLPQHI